MTQIVAGTAQAPGVFTGILLANMFLLGAVLGSQFYLSWRVNNAATEIRLLQLQVQDQTAVMIRDGLIRPGDLTNGPTAPSALPQKRPQP